MRGGASLRCGGRAVFVVEWIGAHGHFSFIIILEVPYIRNIHRIDDSLDLA